MGKRGLPARTRMLMLHIHDIYCCHGTDCVHHIFHDHLYFYWPLESGVKPWDEFWPLNRSVMRYFWVEVVKSSEMPHLFPASATLKATC